MLLPGLLAQIEYREWERQFNARAARGDFVPRPRQAPRWSSRPRPGRWLRQLRRVIGEALSPVWSSLE